MSGLVSLKYTGVALPTLATTHVLFATAPPSAGVAGSCALANWGPMSGLHTYKYDIKHDQTGTVKGYKSNDRGATWVQFYDSGVMAIPTYSSSNVVSIEGLADFKFEWLNGGSTQGAFAVSQDCSTYP